MDGTIDDDFILIDHPCRPPTTSITSTPTSYLPTISTHINHLSPKLRDISLIIHDNPELNYEEFKAYALLEEFFEGLEGWKVEEKACGIETAFIAVLIIQEGRGRVGGKGLRWRQDRTPKRRSLCKTQRRHIPNLPSRNHPDASLVRTSAFQAFRIEYFGLEAHAAAAPWEGINALDALITAYTSISVLRQQTQSGDIIQGCITQGGVKPNIIHAYASGDFVVRSTTKQRLEALKKRVDKCFEGAAVATGAKLKMTLQSRYLDHVPNVPLGRGYAKHFTALGGKLRAPEMELLTGSTQASTDQGDISHAMPSISAGFRIESVAEDGGQGGGPHTPDFTRASRTEKAHEKALMVGQALAATAVDVLTVEGYLEEIKKEFKRGREQIAEVK
ncbi:unnamed protein product [Aureobasidium pullulans]|nr:unnamed protein product [Aureobasidium pullulans]